ncbi:MAG: hypothetical protein WCJ29_05140 [bacterium]
MALVLKTGIAEPLHYLEKKVRFSFAQCDYSKYCVTKLNSDEVKRFYVTMGNFEKLTWDQVRKLPRDKGISIDKAGSDAYRLLQLRSPTCSTFGHFRVDGVAANTRIFVGIQDDLAAVHLIDRKGVLQHS